MAAASRTDCDLTGSVWVGLVQLSRQPAAFKGFVSKALDRHKVINERFVIKGFGMKKRLPRASVLKGQYVL